ncbi:serine/threonine-protein kinase pakE-like [Corticium candelabrum]|uniref:serine/threonine-protein kinase pakE-like n=1 Tax=Corticium candelabrum TaxID=121492 RepID=UPI002E25A463|nr:serine/threonine-protein kinase pakE-like [Corticium candelabrum]
MDQTGTKQRFHFIWIHAFRYSQSERMWCEYTLLLVVTHPVLLWRNEADDFQAAFRVLYSFRAPCQLEVGVGMWSGVAVAVKTFYEEPVRVTDFNISLIRREVSVSSRVHHPNVVSICGAIVKNRVPLRIVMELLEGSLKDVINAAIENQISLQPAVLHGDIRSTNILISETMEAKIGDLGSCRFSNESLSVGPLSPEYIAPERVVDDGAVAPRNTTQADMYSLGVTFVELFTGVATDRKVRERQFQTVPYVPLQDICYAMAEENPRDRISARAALMQVNAVKQNDEYTSCPPKRMVKGKKRKEDKVTLIEMPWM